MKVTILRGKAKGRRPTHREGDISGGYLGLLESLVAVGGYPYGAQRPLSGEALGMEHPSPPSISLQPRGSVLLSEFQRSNSDSQQWSPSDFYQQQKRGGVPLYTDCEEEQSRNGRLEGEGEDSIYLEREREKSAMKVSASVKNKFPNIPAFLRFFPPVKKSKQFLGPRSNLPRLAIALSINVLGILLFAITCGDVALVNWHRKYTYGHKLISTPNFGNGIEI